MITKYDKAVIFGLIIFAGIAYALFNLFVIGENATQMVIYINGRVYAKYELSEFTKDEEITIKTEFGTNTVKVAGGEISVVSASCPDKLDVKSKPISKSGQSIVCIPNRFSVRLSGGNTGVDKVAY